MMQGDPRVDELMQPVNAAIRRHVKNRDAITEIYNRAYEAVMEVQDALNIAAAVTAKQIAENAKNLQLASRAERAEQMVERLIKAGNELDIPPDDFSEEQKEWREIVAEWRGRNE